MATAAVNAKRVDGAWASRAAEEASVFAERVRARCASGEPADGQPVASASSITSSFCDVQACVSMCMAGEARTHGACMTSVLCTRVLVCKAQRSERAREMPR